MSDPTPLASVPIEMSAIAKASFERCCAHGDFFICFYRNFFKNCPEVEPMFRRTDFKRQHNLLRHAIGLLLIFPNQPADEPTILTRIAERHGRQDLDVDPSLYTGFVTSLLQTVAEHDPEFDPDIEAAWRHTIAPGIAYMQEHH